MDIRGLLSVPDEADEVAVERILARSGDRSAREWLLHLPDPEAIDRLALERSVLRAARSPRRRRPRWVPLGLGLALAGAAAAAALVGGVGRRGADPSSAAIEGPSAEAAPPGGSAQVAVEVPALTGRDYLLAAHRRINGGEGEDAALEAVAAGLEVAEDEEVRRQLAELELLLLDRAGRAGQAREAACDYAGRYPESPLPEGLDLCR